MDQLSALVERSKFFAQTVDRLAGRKGYGRGPLLAAAQSANRRQSLLAAEGEIAARAEHRNPLVQQPERERFAGQFEGRVASTQRPHAELRLGNGAGFCLRADDTVIRRSGRAEAKPEHAA